MTQTDPQRPILVIDSSSPLLSVAIGRPSEIDVELESESSRSSQALMALIDQALSEAHSHPQDLGSVVVLAGPGSFTGLRVGMAVALGFHQALGLAAGTVSTFLALARRSPQPQRESLALVRALRGTWYAQRFERGFESDGDPFLLRDEDLASRRELLIGFDLPASPSPGPLAGGVLGLSEMVEWDPVSLTRPAYLAPPPTHGRTTNTPPSP